MLYVVSEIPVNGKRESDEPPLTRSQVWEGLLLKANNALPFVAAMTKCEVIERFNDGLIRTIEVHGKAAQERITLYPGKRVVFLRLSGPADGLIVNKILDDEDGTLKLRFSFALQLIDAASDSAEENEFKTFMERDYTKAATTTLSAIRKAVKAGQL